jgi:hypothetical protein
LNISGLPFTSDASATGTGSLEWQGITKAGFTSMIAKVAAGDTIFRVIGCGSGVSATSIQASDMPTGGTIRLIGNLTYIT